jgi:SAM-dependent methyltransferase
MLPVNGKPNLQRRGLASRLLYPTTIFFSAFLLFLVQPIIAKLILPWFGGSAAVWVTCLLFFQVALLIGYIYAHYLVRLSPRFQSRVHLTALAASLLVLPILPRDFWKPSGPEHPAGHILLLLTATIGLPYLVLCSTSPLLQAWYAQGRGTERQPYRLFALSNAGSMLALLGYPALVEPLSLRRHQAVGWSVAYAGVCLLCAVVALRAPCKAVINTHTAPVPEPGWTVQLLWVALAACASALLLAVTNHLTQNLAAIPFLWLLPLTLYLLSFILCFEGSRWYRRGLFVRLLAVALGAMTYALSPDFDNIGLKVLIPLYAAGLFVCCMFCHGELAQLKPHPARLTSFYLMISLGGAIGGLFVAFLAPQIFPGYFELPIALAACGVLALVVLRRTPGTVFYKAGWHPGWLLVVALALALVMSLAKTTWDRVAQTRVMVRNFYGCLRVIDYELSPEDLIEAGKEDALGEDWRCRKLMNGTIDHGVQLLALTRRRRPTAYYGVDSGIGRTLRALRAQGPLRVGIVGLGTGTIAAFARLGDYYTFYEINPLDIQLANAEFTFVRDSPARVDIVPGDARLSLEREPPQQFDVLALDAFSSDAIPIHLLTREAMALYFRQLKPGGVLAANISNKYLDLKPVFAGATEWLGKRAVVIDTQSEKENAVYRAVWVLVSSRPDFFDVAEIRQLARPIEKLPGLKPWTDDYSNLLAVLK